MSMTSKWGLLLGGAVALLGTTNAAWAKTGDPVAIGGGFKIDPILDARLRYEHVDQPTLDADAITLRVRGGMELQSDSGFSFLAEAEATLGIHNHYNDTNAGNGVEPYSVVADPQNVELNRLQIQYANKNLGRITVGRQRINLDDQRFVGSVGWRQNEQTFDAVTVALTAIKPLTFEATYAISVRTIFGNDAGPRRRFNGEYLFLGAGLDLGKVKTKAFYYLIDYDPGQPVSLSSNHTYGGRATAALPVTKAVTVNLAASYARQSDYGLNPAVYSVDYIAAEAGIASKRLGLSLGYEKLGADGRGNRFQTPLATLHKFNGWADLFLSTPAAGLQDYYGTLTAKFPGVKALPGLNASLTYHRFDSDVGGLRFGDEWDAQIGFKFKMIDVQVKYADFNGRPANGFADKKIFWLQFGYGF